ncbi:MAG: ATP-binding cassette domain-containing protein [Fimbriimonadaceae bacterium]
MTIDEACAFFQPIPKIYRKLETLQQVGLGYLRMGQPATTLSGGEAQRVKLATELSKRSTGRTLYILDEPTTGLTLRMCVGFSRCFTNWWNQGNTVLVIEHNLDVIKTADLADRYGAQREGSGGGKSSLVARRKDVAKNKGATPLTCAKFAKDA